MPELPEVETIRRDLVANILHKKIAKVTIGKNKLIKNSSAKFKQAIIGHKFTDISRIGKLLIFALSKKNTYLLIHLKMTGQLIYQSHHQTIAGGHNYPPIQTKLPNKYSHVIFEFEDHSTLFFNDQRQFGYLQIVDHQQLDSIKSQFGIEPLTKNFTFKNFRRVLSDKNTYLKNILLNQKHIAGIGNIYADEICFAANILPQTRANKLNNFQQKKLFQSCQKTIKKAIKHRGTTFQNYVDPQGQKGNYTELLQVYGRENQICNICQANKIKKIKLVGRGTHFCANCQK
ncbi:bifunctional DNA-formamidopyrimidine glycosylase/DNA-(apurinic or apyrimidinic site) lyase [Patescibacteria group bacterium]|nr:bifunctional DNA-formamidopyrimidine glycosylase/DNA-(apurinic or apyrimidinic site) lyase [Patescibacteria group bacterium]